MAWALHRSTAASAREISAHLAEQAAADRSAASPIGAEEEALSSRADGSPANAVRYGNWLITHHRELDAVRFYDQLHSPLEASAEVRSGRTEALARTGASEELKHALERGDWGPMDGYTVDLALAARIAAEMKHLDLAAELWRSAVAAGAGGASAAGLSRLGQIWKSQSSGAFVR